MVRRHLNPHIAATIVVVIAAAKRCCCLWDHSQSPGPSAGLSTSDNSEWSSDSFGFSGHSAESWHGRDYLPWNYFLASQRYYSI